MGESGHTLVLGGARSGKSRYAEELALTQTHAPAYLATGQAHDGEMQARISRHQADRNPRFITIEEPLDLTGRLKAISHEYEVVLVDCLTLWISNLMAAERDVDAAVAELEAWLSETASPRLTIVSNEVGLGIVPDNGLARTFRDHAGRAHQRLAHICDTVLFVAAGLPLAMKGDLPELS